MGVKRLDGLETPSLSLPPLSLGPDHRLPVRRQDEAGAGVGEFHAVTGGLPDVEEERPLDRVLVRTRLDVDAVLQEDVGRAQDVLAGVGGIGHVVEPAQGRPLARPVLLGAGEVVGLVVDREPAAADPPVVEADHLGHAGAEAGFHEAAELGHVRGQEVQVIEPARRRAPPVVARREVLQRRAVIARGLEAARVPVELEHVAERILEAEGAAVAEVAVHPTMDPEPAGLDGGDPPRQRLGRGHPVGDVAHAGGIRARELEGAALVIVPGAQVGAALIARALGEAVDAREEVEALLEAVRQDLDVAEMSRVVAGLRHSSSTVRGNTDWNPSAYWACRPPDWPPELRWKWFARFCATRV